MIELNVRLFGGFEVRRSAGPIIVFPTRKARALLAFLARHPGQPHGREGLAAMFWPDSAESEARRNLRQALKLVRRALADRSDAIIVIQGDALVLEPSTAEVDVDLFERLDEAGTPDALERAAALYRGDFLEGVNLADGPFADWSLIERMRLHARALDVFSRLLADRLEAERTEAAIDMALRLLALDPLQEHVHRQLIRLYLEQGRRGSAREQYQLCRAVLERELGSPPEAETERLYQEIRRCRVELPASASEPSSQSASPPPSPAVDLLLTRPAVAVLPFVNLGGDPSQTYFADGLSEDIITALASWRCFPLIASSSTFCYRECGDGLHDIAAELGTHYLVEGSVRSSGTKLRISAHLVEVETARYLWAERFDLDLHDILVVQGEAAEKIVAAIAPELQQAELRRIMTKRTEEWSAWDYFLRGWSLLNHFTIADNARARYDFEQALRLDPAYSDAFMGLASGYLRDLFHDEAAASREEALARGLTAAREAVSLDPNSSAAHHALGTAYTWVEDYEAAIAETELAIELNPSNAFARMALGNRLDLIGQTAEGIAQMRHALRLNPRDPRRFNFMRFLARAHIALGEYEIALRWSRKAVQLRPDQPDLHFRLAICLAHLDRTEEARAALHASERLRPGFLESRKRWQPYADADRNEHFFAGLRRHGLFGQAKSAP